MPDPQLVWVVLNGECMPAARAHIPLGCGLSAGEGALEVFRTTPYGPFLGRRHLERLRATCRMLGIESPGVGELRADIGSLNSVRTGDWRLRLVVASDGQGGTLRAMEATALSLRDPSAAGRVIVREGSVTALPGFKTTSYVASRYFVRAAKVSGADECFVGERGILREGATSNVFLVKSGRLLTPNDEGILAGITRGRVLELAIELGIEVVEGRVALDELKTADEVFFTSSVRGLVPVSVVDGCALPRAPGPITGRLMSAYAQDLAADWGELRVERVERGRDSVVASLLADGGRELEGAFELDGVRVRVEALGGASELTLCRTHRGAGETLAAIAAALR